MNPLKSACLLMTVFYIVQSFHWLIGQYYKKDINTLYIWSQTWQMCFNAKKCHILNISRKRQKKSKTLFSIILARKHCRWWTHPYLGVTLSSDLRWHEQIQPGLSILFAVTSTLVHLQLKHLPIPPWSDHTSNMHLPNGTHSQPETLPNLIKSNADLHASPKTTTNGPSPSQSHNSPLNSVGNHLINAEGMLA